MNREYTTKEVRTQFLKHCRFLAHYWAKVKRDTIEEQMEGLVFSILSTLDGCSANLPGFAIIPITSESDREYYKNKGENWYPHVSLSQEANRADIGGILHEMFPRIR